MRTELEKRVHERTKALLDSELRSKDLADHLGVVLETARRVKSCLILLENTEGMIRVLLASLLLQQMAL